MPSSYQSHSRGETTPSPHYYYVINLISQSIASVLPVDYLHCQWNPFGESPPTGGLAGEARVLQIGAIDTSYSPVVVLWCDKYDLEGCAKLG